jgi:hypothetical protein
MKRDISNDINEDENKHKEGEQEEFEEEESVFWTIDTGRPKEDHKRMIPSTEEKKRLTELGTTILPQPQAERGPMKKFDKDDIIDISDDSSDEEKEQQEEKENNQLSLDENDFLIQETTRQFSSEEERQEERERDNNESESGEETETERENQNNDWNSGQSFGSDKEKNQKDRVRSLRIDDFDDDESHSSSSSSSSSSSEEEENEDNDSAAVDDEDNILLNEEEKEKTNGIQELEEDLDIQVIGYQPPSQLSGQQEEAEQQQSFLTHSSSARSLLPSEMEFDNSFQLDSDDGEFVTGKNHSNSKEKKKQLLTERETALSRLKALVAQLKGMDWTNKIDFRPRAKVPIINFFHSNSVECDVSIGLAAKDTSELVKSLKEKTGPVLFVLSAFLKIYLNQLELDKPFTGGLGSFKLYLMIATHIKSFFPGYLQDYNQQQKDQKTSTPTISTPSKNNNIKNKSINYGEMLLSFLKFYGNPNNLYEKTEILFEDAAVSFETTRLATEIQKSFNVAYAVLIKAYRIRLEIFEERKQREKDKQQQQQPDKRMQLPVSWNDKQPQQALLANNKNNNQNDFSLSLIGTVLDAKRLQRERKTHQTSCQRYPWRSLDERNAVAEEVLSFLLKELEIFGYNDEPAISFSQLESLNPTLAMRLRSFLSLERAIQSVQNSTGGGGLLRRNRFESDNNGLLSSNPNTGRKRKEYSFSHYGVVGNSIQQSFPGTTNNNSSSNSNMSNRARKQLELKNKRLRRASYPLSEGKGVSSYEKQENSDDNHDYYDIQEEDEEGARKGNKKRKRTSEGGEGRRERGVVQERNTPFSDSLSSSSPLKTKEYDKNPIPIDLTRSPSSFPPSLGNSKNGNNNKNNNHRKSFPPIDLVPSLPPAFLNSKPTITTEQTKALLRSKILELSSRVKSGSGQRTG